MFFLARPSVFSCICRSSLVATRSCSSEGPRTVQLAFETFEDVKPKDGNLPKPLIILHGLFGHKGNWKSVAKELNAKTGRKVFTVDARNHGRSPWTDDMNFYAMADDLAQFIKEHELEKPAIMGHSMGGRTAMCLALIHPLSIEKIVVVDVAPRKSRSTLENIPAYLKRMDEVTFDSGKSLADVRKQADEQLADTITDDEVRKFILNNLVDTAEDGEPSWLLNIKSVQHNIKHLQRMPDFNRAFHADALFIGGTRSLGLTKADHLEIHRLFPRAWINHIEGAGHWVHIDKPDRFYKLVVEFLNQPSSL